MESTKNRRFDIWKDLLQITEIRNVGFSQNFDLPNQQVIKLDVERTRTTILTEQEKGYLEILLTHYCKAKNTPYTQGMNEIMVLFVLMIREGISLQQAYCLFESFIQQVLPKMFGTDFKPLHALFIIFKLLLRYHEPVLSSYFHTHGISPELFSTCWFITVFSSKINDIEIIYKLWETLIKEKDYIFVAYIAVALLTYSKNHILAQEEISIPQTLSQLSIHSMQELTEILKIASRIKSNMPYSIKIKLNQINIYNIDHVDSYISSLEKDLCFTVHPREIMHRAYPEMSICNCKHNDCAWCINKTNDIPLFLIDFRTENEQQAGTVPNSIVVSVPFFVSDENLQQIVDQYEKMKEIFHFCILSSEETIANTNYDEMNQENPDLNTLERLLICFEKNGFSHISLAEGGFEKCHEFAMHYKLQLENHQEEYCLVCTPDGPNIASLMKSKLKKFRSSMLGTMRRTFSLDSNLEKLALEAKLQSENNLQKSDPASSFFISKKYDKNSNTIYDENYFFYLKSQYLTIGILGDPELSTDSRVTEEFKIIDLLKITSINSTQKILTFYFSGSKKVHCYVIIPNSLTRSFIDQIKKQFLVLKKKK
ncbi:TBC1D23_8 [Blepharisma stoltei]|uniref:Rab-GAP TBC domain-containing protein n=1 Tax=Blepharisma stoltei TaxID=1481888 RepID=A0AAU9IWS5_9CILI|nr:unnamed protein product [Blepharisma stoltei]